MLPDGERFSGIDELKTLLAARPDRLARGVAGQMLGFFAEMGFTFPQFPYIAHSRGWSHEDMERNVEILRDSAELADGAAMLAKRCLDLADRLAKTAPTPASIERGGRKAHPV